MSDWPPNGTNLELFKTSFSTFWLDGTNLTLIGVNTDIRVGHISIRDKCNALNTHLSHAGQTFSYLTHLVIYGMKPVIQNTIDLGN